MLNRAIAELQVGIKALNDLNQILFDNWKDKVADDYKNNIVNPLSTSLTQYINRLNSADRDIDRLLCQVDTNYARLLKGVREYQSQEYAHKGWPIFGMSGEKYKGHCQQFNFIVSPSQFPQVCDNEKVATQVAFIKHPDMLVVDKIGFTGNLV